MKTKLKQSVVATAAMLILVACGEDKKANVGPASAEIYGRWGGLPALTLAENGIEYQATFEIILEPGRLTTNLVCAFADGKVLKSYASGAARFDAATIQGLEEKANVKRDGVRTCTVRLHQDSANYVLRGNELVLHKGGQVLVLKRL